MKVLYLVAGVPGSGKTTLAESLIKSGLVDEHYEADMFFIQPDGQYYYNAARSSDAHEWCLTQTENAMLRNKNVVVSNTFTKDAYLNRYLALASDLEYNVVEIVMKSSFHTEKKGVSFNLMCSMRTQLQERLDEDWAWKCLHPES